ncbi:SusD/RagB family nutrient-binding outer membrane lipoprotein [Hymenobacter sp. HSC-4F20]|uniref:SusD/RagB family nutrient-binding outer membrane lipoprotein n=1 Tax=Hymenobacter sp. HSC-4F20 TaxID=2864135 RepID=UPI001C72AC5A|nr:SusD/RagB family nutrient-binding outer membrane lipoprotein [Hymenobacter sp. HSC-4F20]MBX0290806.1 SusD/RagB family nutrient-binding outer membrane lipoprotein [Hymenobacter sp. HSC-4F20]
MKKSLLLILPALGLVTSCVETLDDYNVDPKRPTAVPASSLVASAERSLTRTVVSPNVNLNIFRLISQYWAETTYFDESIYDLVTRNIPTGYWNAYYRDVLRDLKEAKSVINSDNALNAAVKKNQLASIEVLEVYAWANLVDAFGNIPYSQSLDFNTSQPKYDDAKTIYADLITRLDGAIGNFDASAEGLGSGDLLYGGDVSHFAKFANSLKLRLAMTIADDDPAKSRTMVQQAAGKVFTSNEDNAELAFLGANPNTNPLYEDLVQSGRNDFVGTSFFINRLQTLNDPRLGSYFKAKNGAYVGGVYGTSNNYASFSAPSEELEDPTLPGVLLSYAQVEFWLSEAAARGGYTVAGTAKSHYDAAVTASIQEWGGTTADATAYLAQPTVDVVPTSANYKQVIGEQTWIALYNQPVDSWREWRRYDYPQLAKPAGALTNIPKRFFYPIVEQNLNTTNYNAAASAIGGDNVDTKIFWDKF